MIKQLKQIDIFKELDDMELRQISDITTTKRLSSDNILFYEGDESNCFYALLEGHLKLYKTGIKSNEIVLHYFVNPTMVAEMATLENIKFPATAAASKDDTLVAIIDKEKFLKILKDNSDFSFHIIKSLTKKIKNLEVAINRNLIFDATTKVCSMLKEQPDIFQTNKNKKVASILNMAPETLSRTVTKLKKLNIIDNDQKLINEDKLDMFLQF
ncbi:MAG: Crp/Fnr family transcriptional regulator [Campylobacterota bacterium]|nr:Crp/Fnr family transcriptional regulator [Campylobacterota bacterium]